MKGPLLVSCWEIAEVFGVSQMMLTKYKKAGMWRHVQRRGVYDLDACVEWFMRNHVAYGLWIQTANPNRVVRQKQQKLHSRKGKH